MKPRKEGAGGGGVCFLLKPEIRESDRPSAAPCRGFSLLSIPLRLHRGEGGASGRFALLNSLQSITH